MLTRVLQLLSLSTLSMSKQMMNWNHETISYATALRIGWNLPQDVVGSGVYGGIIKRTDKGKIVVGDEWPENNIGIPAHNPVHATGPYLDFTKYTEQNRGYTAIAQIIMAGDVDGLDSLLTSAGENATQLSNLVMTGGARPLHMCGMSRGGDASALVQVLLKHGADVNAKDNYELSPFDRLASNSVVGNEALRKAGALEGRKLPSGVPEWKGAEYKYVGIGETSPILTRKNID
jgi:hypothetical protein